MGLNGPAVQRLYTAGIDRYSSFVAAFQSRQGIQALLEDSPVLRPGLRVLDAGCGFGMATFAFIDALRKRNLDYQSIDAFDLTPAMLRRFEEMLEGRGVTRVQLRQADVLALETLPPSWTGYDLILSTSMLEYLPKQDLPRALEGLRARLAPNGHMLAMITRKTPETKILIDWWWRAQRYTKVELLSAFETAGFRDLVFRRFPLRYFWLNRGSYVVDARALEGGEDVLRACRFTSIFLTALTLSLTFCHLLEMPRKMQYDQALYMAVQHSLYLHFAWVGAIAETGAVASLVAVSVLTRNRGFVFHLTLAATICVAAGFAAWLLFVSPANTQMAQWSAVPLPSNWTDVRRQWEFGHALSSVLDLIGFGALVLSVVAETR